MTKEIRSPNTEGRSGVRSPDSSFGFRYSFGFRHSSFVIRIWELRFMESPLSIFRMHWDHEPKMRNLFICKGSILRFMESPLSFIRMHWDHEPKMRNLFICKGSILRFMESPLSFFRMHWDHELVRVCSADFPACGFTGHSCPVFLLRATGKSPEPADRNVCPTHPRFMESP